MRTTSEIMKADEHLIQSFADLNALKDPAARTSISRAKGPFVWDSDGNQLIDGIAGLWCVNAGHGRKEIIDAITEQLHTLDYYSTFYNFTHPPAAELAKKLSELAPGHLNKVHFANSGSDANDSAVRILHHYNIRLGKPHKKIVISRHGAYHGSTHLAMALTTPGYSEGWHCARELVHHVKCPHYWREGGGRSESEFLDFLIEDLRSTIETIGPENICGFIAEPIMGAGGIITAPAGYHMRAWEVCQYYDVKYISDEIVTAFGRLGHMFASKDLFDVQPDIITSAKGLTSGYQPLAATIISDEIYDVISGPDGMFLHGTTYGGHPAAAAAALANIAILENEKIPRKVKTTGKYFENKMHELRNLELVGDVRGSHFMIGIEFVKNKITKESYPAEFQVALKVARACQRHGLIARPLGNILILSPTLIMEEPMIDEVYKILEQAITDVTRDL